MRQPPRSTHFPYTTLLPISGQPRRACRRRLEHGRGACAGGDRGHALLRSEEHTSELQSRFDLVCRLLLEKKNARSSLFIIPTRSMRVIWVVRFTFLLPAPSR